MAFVAIAMVQMPVTAAHAAKKAAVVEHLHTGSSALSCWHVAHAFSTSNTVVKSFHTTAPSF